MLAGESPTIYGSGLQTRDFIFVGDVVGAIMAALAHEGTLAGDGVDGPAYNVSTGAQTSVLELAGILRMHTRFTREFATAPPREGDIEHSALDPSKAADAFGWRASAPIQGALAMTVQWFATQS
jgi:UDP-glucose 4-epimerase